MSSPLIQQPVKGGVYLIVDTAGEAQRGLVGQQLLVTHIGLGDPVCAPYVSVAGKVGGEMRAFPGGCLLQRVRMTTCSCPLHAFPHRPSSECVPSLEEGEQA